MSNLFTDKLIWPIPVRTGLTCIAGTLLFLNIAFSLTVGKYLRPNGFQSASTEQKLIRLQMSQEMYHCFKDFSIKDSPKIGPFTTKIIMCSKPGWKISGFSQSLDNSVTVLEQQQQENLAGFFNRAENSSNVKSVCRTTFPRSKFGHCTAKLSNYRSSMRPLFVPKTKGLEGRYNSLIK